VASAETSGHPQTPKRGAGGSSDSAAPLACAVPWKTGKNLYCAPAVRAVIGGNTLEVGGLPPMASAQFAAVYRQIGRLFRGGSVAGLSEGELLDRFVARHDDDAFEAIVARHGPMVLSVCRALLRDPNDVDDAFQAVFLVLVRKADALRHRERLGNWLYGVAQRVARRASSDASRRRAQQTAHVEPADPAEADLERFDLRSLIHDEVNRLPSNYREAIVLCYFQGRTHEEAAHELGWPVGTVRGRLARARDLLRSRLMRRGIAPASGALVATLCHEGRAALPPMLASSTTAAASAVASGSVTLATLTTLAVSARALALSQGVLHAMSTTQLKLAATALVAAGILSSTGVSAYQAPASGPTQIAKTTKGASVPAPGLAEQRVQLAAQVVDTMSRLARSGELPQGGEELLSWRRRLLDDRIAAGMPRARAVMAFVVSVREDVAATREGFKRGQVNLAEVKKAEYFLLQAEALRAEEGATPQAAPAAPAVAPPVNGPAPQADVAKAAPRTMPSPPQWKEDAPPEDRVKVAEFWIARIQRDLKTRSEYKTDNDARRLLADMLPLWQNRLDASHEQITAARTSAQSRIKIAEEAIAQLQKKPDRTTNDTVPNYMHLSAWEARLKEARQAAEGPDHGYQTALRTLEAAKASEASAKADAHEGEEQRLAYLNAQFARIEAQAAVAREERARQVRAIQDQAAATIGGLGGVGMGGGMGGMGGGLNNTQGVVPYMGGFIPVPHTKATPKPENVERNRQIEERLQKRVPMHFATETPLRDILAHIKSETADAKGKVIPIYVDPIALQEAEKTLDSTVTIDLEDIPVRITLRLLLDQLGFFYRVDEGMVFIEAKQADDANHTGEPTPLPVDLERNRVIEAALNRDASMPFGTDTPIREVLQHIREKVRDPEGKMIPIYVDPISLQEAEKTLESPIRLELEDVPVRTTLRLILKQISMIYKVEDGMLKVTVDVTVPDSQGNISAEGNLLRSQRRTAGGLQ
jgi:RNA polymerase sigma factor (sigma-70 family)